MRAGSERYANRKERYRYLLRAINGVPQKHQKDVGGLASTAVPRPAPITPGTFLKKRKAEISEEEEEVQEDKGATTPIPKPKRRKSETATVKTKQPKSNATARANNKAKVAKDAEPEDEQQEAGLEVEDTDRVGAKDYNPHLTPRDPSKAFLCNGLADNLLTPEEHADLNSDIDAGDLNRLFPDLGGWVR